MKRKVRGYFRKVLLILRFIPFLIGEIVLANLKVASDVVTPGHNSRPGVIAIPLSCKTDIQITLFANLISLTPGTLTLDISNDRQYLYLHAMFVEDPEKMKNHIKYHFERRILEFFDD